MTYDPSQVVFLDTETTGLDPKRHEVWEIGLIADGVDYHWLLPIDETSADLIALNIGGYHERHPDGRTGAGDGIFAGTERGIISVAEAIARLTHGRHIIGAVPDFDSRFLTKLLLRHEFLPSWHYHLIDVEALMVGHIMNGSTGPDTDVTLPWRSKDLSRLVGVDPTQFEEHTALGDARWAKACFEAVMGGPS